MRMGRTQRHGPISRNCLALGLGSIMRSVTEAMTPAAAGMGQPVKSREGFPSEEAARQLKRARRMAPQRT